MSKKTHITIGTFKGVKELAEKLTDSTAREQWGLSQQQFKELKQTYKKIRQAEKKTGSSRANAEKSAMNEFYRVMGLNPDGTLKPNTNTDMFGMTKSKDNKGGGTVYAKFPVKGVKPASTGSIRDLSNLSDNIYTIKQEMDYYNVFRHLSSSIREDYLEWIDAFMEAAGLGGIDYNILNALDFLVNNTELLRRTTNWLSNRGIEINLTGDIYNEITNAISNMEDAPYEYKNFLLNLRNRM